MGAELLVEVGRAGETAAGASTAWIERKSGLTPREFLEQHLRPRRPVVLTDALRDWPALQRFSHEFCRTQFGHLPAKVRAHGYRLADVLDLQIASTLENPGPYPCTLAQCAELLPYLTPRFACSLPTRHLHRLVPQSLFHLVNHTEIFFGGPGGSFPRVHCDMLHLHAWITQVHGEKEVTVYEPGQEELLYVTPGLPWLSAIQDPHDFTRYPLLRQARAQHVVLRAGEALFVPSGTWHTARCLGLNITVAFDQLESTNWPDFVRDVMAEQRRDGKPVKALLLGAYLRALGAALRVAECFGANRRADWSAS